MEEFYEELRKLMPLKNWSDLISEEREKQDFREYLLFNKGLISNFTIDVQNYDIIKECVKCHNKYCIDNEKMYDEKTLTQLKIIRDADKLDILNIFANLNETDVNSDGSISKEVENQFFNNEILDNRSKKTNGVYK